MPSNTRKEYYSLNDPQHKQYQVFLQNVHTLQNIFMYNAINLLVMILSFF